MSMIIDMYTTMMTVIIGGIFNMAFVKLPVLDMLKRPIDRGRVLKDGRKLFGENKTYKGFAGMVILTMLANVLWGYLCSVVPGLGRHNILYLSHRNSLDYNVLAGALLGLAYVIFELPNSFVKRRVGIRPGKSKWNGIGLFFICIDQTDSLFGCALIIAVFSPMTLWYYFLFVFIGGITHLLINVLLYMVKLKKNV